MTRYVNADALVDTQWVADHLNDPHVRLLEVGLDVSEYESGHIPGTVAGWGQADLQPIEDKARFEAMMSQAGIANGDTLCSYSAVIRLSCMVA